MSNEEDIAVFRLAVRYWSEGNFDGVVDLLAEDVVHNVNVDALEIPWVSSAAGKADVTVRLGLIAQTFIINAFIIENLICEGEEIRATVLGYHRHRKTGERLDVRVRFRVRVENGLLAHIDEFLDAAYIDAFQRFVTYLEQTALEAGLGPPGH